LIANGTESTQPQTRKNQMTHSFNPPLRAASCYAHALLCHEINELLSRSNERSLVILVVTPNNEHNHQFRVGVCAEFEFGLQELVPSELSSPRKEALHTAEFWLLHGKNARNLLNQDPFQFFTSMKRPTSKIAHCNKSKKFAVAVEGSDNKTNLKVGKLFFKAMECFMRRAGEIHLEKENVSKDKTITVFLEWSLGRLEKKRRIEIPKRRSHLKEVKVR